MAAEAEATESWKVITIHTNTDQYAVTGNTGVSGTDIQTEGLEWVDTSFDS